MPTVRRLGLTGSVEPASALRGAGRAAPQATSTAVSGVAAMGALAVLGASAAGAKASRRARVIEAGHRFRRHCV